MADDREFGTVRPAMRSAAGAEITSDRYFTAQQRGADTSLEDLLPPSAGPPPPLPPPTVTGVLRPQLDEVDKFPTVPPGCAVLLDLGSTRWVGFNVLHRLPYYVAGARRVQVVGESAVGVADVVTWLRGQFARDSG